MKAIEAAIESVGGQQVELARRISVTAAAVSQWVNEDRPVPAGRCLAIEEATGGAVTRYDLRPDVFGPAPSNEKAA